MIVLWVTILVLNSKNDNACAKSRTSALGVIIMKNLNVFSNGAAQFVFGSLKAANAMTLKSFGFITNEAGNFVGAALNLASDRTRKALIDPSMEDKHFAHYVRAQHTADQKAQRYLNGTVPVEEILKDLTTPDWINDILENDKGKVTQPITITDQD